MANLNKVLLIGNLTRDPEVRYTPKGTAVADIGLAINRIWTNEQNQRQEETTFVDITLWGRQAELAQQYLTKGRGVFIEGRLQMDTWEDKQSGQKRSKLKVVAENLQFLPDGKGGSNPPAMGGNSRPAAAATGGQRPVPQGASPAQEEPGGYPGDEDDDIPF
jgi:single-strand DNA-binding protein